MTDPIATLSDRDAIRLLALVIDHSQPLPDPAHQQQMDTRLQEVADHTPPEPGDTTPVTAGDLARATLHHLAETPDTAAVIARAAAIPPGHDRLDPATVSIGALALLAPQTEVKLTRTPNARWTLHIHKPSMRDSTLTNLITKLINFYRPPR